MYRIIWIQGNIWVLNLCLIYQIIHGKNLTSCFSKTRVYLIGVGRIWRHLYGWVLRAELSWQRYQDKRLLLHSKSDKIGKTSLLFKMCWRPFYPVSRRPLFLPWMGLIASYLSKPSFKNAIMIEIGRLKRHDDKRLEVWNTIIISLLMSVTRSSYKIIITFKFKMQFLFCFHRINAKRFWLPGFW